MKSEKLVLELLLIVFEVIPASNLFGMRLWDLGSDFSVGGNTAIGDAGVAAIAAIANTLPCLQEMR